MADIRTAFPSFWGYHNASHLPWYAPKLSTSGRRGRWNCPVTCCTVPFLAKYLWPALSGKFPAFYVAGLNVYAFLFSAGRNAVYGTGGQRWNVGHTTMAAITTVPSETLEQNVVLMLVFPTLQNLHTWNFLTANSKHLQCGWEKPTRCHFLYSLFLF